MNAKDKISNEYEARIMLNENQYENLKNDYTSSHNFKKIRNTNIYYDTDALNIIKSNMVLRKRIIDEKAEITLKIKTQASDVEITSEIPTSENNEISNLLTGKMIAILEENKIEINKLKKAGKLVTDRIEISFPDYLFVLDKNYYNNIIDFNLEIESSSREQANKYLDQITKKYDIVNNTVYISKSHRAILKN